VVVVLVAGDDRAAAQGIAGCCGGYEMNIMIDYVT
jgi:hypothetical protein